MNTLSLHVLHELKSFMEPDEYREFLQTACDTLTQQALALEQQVTVQSWEEARRIAHRLKGTLGSLGCDRLHAVLHALEEGLRQTPPVLPTTETMASMAMQARATLSALKQQFELQPSAE